MESLEVQPFDDYSTLISEGRDKIFLPSKISVATGVTFCKSQGNSKTRGLGRTLVEGNRGLVESSSHKKTLHDSPSSLEKRLKEVEM